MRNLTHTFGAALIVAGIVVVSPAVFLVNQRFQFVRLPWGVFDFQVNAVKLSNTAVAAAFGSVGILLFILGVALFRKRCETRDVAKGKI